VKREEFSSSLEFELDDFQVRAIDALDEGKSVLVAAPTGSGKTVVAEYAVAKALDEGGKAFYTTPLKALSNQKFGDLVRRHGASRVGLLTGDNAINGDAPIVVMTTEVLRNMIYAASPALDHLRYVVLDEVHYLQNPYRGAVWEEVIIHTPPEVDLVCLSATVSNAEEFADWIHTVRGATETIIEERRPVELHNLYAVGDKSAERILLMPTLVDGMPNPEASAFDARDDRSPHSSMRRRRTRAPRRAEVVELLGEEDMLPAIYFIFSRAACDDAVGNCIQYGLRLTTPEERRQIRSIAEEKVESLSDDDLRVLDYGSWLNGLEAGFAAHHAGMVPPFKEAVEACFARALVKVVFATETLSLGINMPARSVVIEKMTKFTGERHEFLTPGEYTQLTGRAGRRGIDDVGYGIVAWSPFVPFDKVANVVSKRTYALTSSFRPTYNMAANLVRRYTPEAAHHLLNLSFGQYRSDSEVVRMEAELDRKARDVERLREKARCELGDIDEYRELQREVQRATRHRPSGRHEIEAALERLKPGDVFVVPGGAAGGRVVVISTARRSGGVKLSVVNGDTHRLVVSARDFPGAPRPITRIELPKPYNPRSKGFVRETAARLRNVKVKPAGDGPSATDARDRKAMEIAEELAAHPVAECPDLRRHIRAAERADHAADEARRLESRVRRRSESLARQFDRVLRVLETWGYVEGWALTDAGETLRRLYHESDLLVAEALRRGLFDDLDPAEVAGLASVFTYETRGPAPAPDARFPSAKLQRRWIEIDRLGRELNIAEDESGLPLTRPPDPGFVALAHGWASGRELDRLLGDDEMSGGDFVRNVKQLIDLVRQLAQVTADPTAARAAQQGADALFRGVVAASSVVSA
jgi:ATP-dependent RNA helicase HelY